MILDCAGMRRVFKCFYAWIRIILKHNIVLQFLLFSHYYTAIFSVFHISQQWNRLNLLFSSEFFGRYTFENHYAFLFVFDMFEFLVSECVIVKLHDSIIWGFFKFEHLFGETQWCLIIFSDSEFIIKLF